MFLILSLFFKSNVTYNFYEPETRILKFYDETANEIIFQSLNEDTTFHHDITIAIIIITLYKSLAEKLFLDD